MLDSLIGLQEKASIFFKEYSHKYKKQMKCTSGCDHCCIGGLSIFTWEAKLIIHWFTKLSKLERDQFIQKWQHKKNTNFTDVTGKKSSPCSFLIAGNCSIYSRRPIICRTQGMGLKWGEDGIERRDCCPLNFTNTTQPQSEKRDELNLDILNKMMAQAQQLFHSSTTNLLPDLQEQQRVQLSDLRDFLIQNYAK